MGNTRILLAEDETITRMDLREMLENLGYTVIGEAGDGIAAVNLARALKPDLVLMDIKMPELDGISAAETLAQEHVTPVLLLTAYSDREFIDRAVDAGVMGYLVKPFAEAQLKPAIDVALERWRETRQIEHDLAQTQEIECGHRNTCGNRNSHGATQKALHGCQEQPQSQVDDHRCQRVDEHPALMPGHCQHIAHRARACVDDVANRERDQIRPATYHTIARNPQQRLRKYHCN